MFINYPIHKKIIQCLILTKRVFGIFDCIRYLLFCCIAIVCVTSCTSDGNGSVPATQIPAVSSRLILGRITTIPLNTSTKKNGYLFTTS